MEVISRSGKICAIQILPPSVTIISLDHVLQAVLRKVDLPTLCVAKSLCSRFARLATLEIWKYTTIRISSNFPSNPGVLDAGNIGTATFFFKLVRNTLPEPELEPEPALWIGNCRKYVPPLQDLIPLIQKYPQSFRSTEFELFTTNLSSDKLQNVIRKLGNYIQNLKLVLYYGRNPTTFEECRILPDLKKLLFEQFPNLKYLKIIALLPATWEPEIIHFDYDISKTFPYCRKTLLLPNLRAFSLQGNLSRKFWSGMNCAAINSKNILQTDKFAKLDISKYYKLQLELIVGRHCAPIFKLETLIFYFLSSTRNNEQMIVGVVTQILEQSCDTLKCLTIRPIENCHSLRIPPMECLENLSLTHCFEQTLKLVLVGGGNDDYYSNHKGADAEQCSIKSKFPSLKSICTSTRFDFAKNFANILSLTSLVSFPSVKSVLVNNYDNSWNRNETREVMYKLFPNIIIYTVNAGGKSSTIIHSDNVC